MKQISGRAIVAVLAAPTSTVVQAHGVEAPIGAVLWSEVGPGRLLAIWSAATPLGSGAEAPEGEPTPYNSATTLYLVNPEVRLPVSRQAQHRRHDDPGVGAECG